jgi:stage II sporulation protein D
VGSLTRREFLAASGLLLMGCAGAQRTGAAAGAGATADRRAPALVGAEPLVRIGLALGEPEARFAAASGAWRIFEKAADETIAVAAAGETWGVRARAPGDLRVVDPRGWLSQAHRRPIRVEPLAAGGASLRVGDRVLAGALEVLEGAEGLTVVNELPLETYLRGVLAREMGGAGHAPEALAAQAVAARTYALRRLGSRAALGFDLHGDVQDQAYAGTGGVPAAASEAVERTRGAALLAGEALVEAYYHSTCGGVTAAVEEAFPEPALPYLVSVEDGDGRGGYHCARSRWFRWRASYERAQVEGLIARNLGRFATLPSTGPGSLVDLEVVEASPGGRALALRIETSTGRFQVARNDIRWLFADGESPGLRSTLFLLRRERSRGFVERVTLTGGGWGHGVGMCQMGAIGRAAAGAGHEEILAHYYRGTRLTRLYS